MKILFNAPQGVFLQPGGAEVQLKRTKEALEDKGHTVFLFNQFNSKLDDADIVHNFGLEQSTERFTKYAAAEKPLVVSSIFWKNKPAHSLLDRIKNRIGNTVEKVGMKMDYYPFSYEKRILERADLVLPNGRSEAEQLKSVYGMDDSKLMSVPNGVEERFAKGSSSLFEKKHEISDFLLYVGGIGHRKNTHQLIKIAEKHEIPLVIIGPSQSKRYKEKCEKLADEYTTFIGRLEHDSELLVSAYHAADTFALPSFFETPGLAALEAALANNKIVLTEVGTTKEYFDEYAWYVDPDSYESIERNILNAWSEDSDESLKQHILDNYTWENVAEKTLEGYKQVLD